MNVRDANICHTSLTLDTCSQQKVEQQEQLLQEAPDEQIEPNHEKLNDIFPFDDLLFHPKYSAIMHPRYRLQGIALFHQRRPMNYTEEPVELLEHGTFAQSKNYKRYLYSPQDKTFEKIDNLGFSREMSNTEITEFKKDITEFCNKESKGLPAFPKVVEPEKAMNNNTVRENSKTTFPNLSDLEALCLSLETNRIPPRHSIGYTEEPVELLGHGTFAQSKNGKRYLYHPQKKTFKKIDNFRLTHGMSNTEITEFKKDITKFCTNESKDVPAFPKVVEPEKAMDNNTARENSKTTFPDLSPAEAHWLSRGRDLLPLPLETNRILQRRSMNYTEEPVELLEHGTFAQSKNGKRYLYHPQNKTFEKIDNFGYAHGMSNTEIEEFKKDITKFCTKKSKDVPAFPSSFEQALKQLNKRPLLNERGSPSYS